jgi:flagellar biosynthesis/type III secretory pathway protein FliH
VDAYLPLEGPQLREFEDWLQRDENRGVKTMATSYLERARQEGHLEGQREALEIQLEGRFGALSHAVRARLAALPADRLRELLRAVLQAQSLHELGLED